MPDRRRPLVLATHLPDVGRKQPRRLPDLRVGSCLLPEAVNHLTVARPEFRGGPARVAPREVIQPARLALLEHPHPPPQVRGVFTLPSSAATRSARFSQVEQLGALEPLLDDRDGRAARRRASRRPRTSRPDARGNIGRFVHTRACGSQAVVERILDGMRLHVAPHAQRARDAGDERPVTVPQVVLESVRGILATAASRFRGWWPSR